MWLYTRLHCVRHSLNSAVRKDHRQSEARARELMNNCTCGWHADVTSALWVGKCCDIKADNENWHSTEITFFLEKLTYIVHCTLYVMWASLVLAPRPSVAVLNICSNEDTSGENVFFWTPSVYKHHIRTQRHYQSCETLHWSLIMHLSGTWKS